MPDDTTRLHLFEQALATMQVGVTIADMNGRIVYVNPAEARMHGYTAEELVGQPTTIFAPPAEAGSRRGPLRLDRVRSWKRETVNARRDGSTFPVELLSDVVTDEDGRPTGLVSISQDITERKRRERALQESEERYALAVLGSKDGIWDWGVADGAFYCSPRWNEMLGLPEAFGSGSVESIDAWLERIHPADREAFETELERHLAGTTDHFESVHRLRRADQAYLWALARGVAVRDEAGTALRVAGSLSDVTDQRARDPLTGLPNRVLFEDRLTHALERSRRQPPDRSETQVGLLFIDLDRFKVINDSLGHLFGDELLTQVGARLSAAVRSGETLARLGGDEFVAILEEVDGVEAATQVAERIHRVLVDPFTVGDHELFISASIGIALGRGGERSVQDLLREADTAMYQAKTIGRAQTRVFDDTMRDLAVEQLELGNQLRAALQNEDLILEYQPIVRSNGRELVGVEALLRWRHPERGVLPPRTFLRLAEDMGLIVPIGRYVLHRACAQLVEWERRLGRAGTLTVSVNVSPKELARPDFVSGVLETLDATGLPPSSLWLEVTEHVLIEDPARTEATLHELRNYGIGIAIDDFGTGYSSLSYLDQLAVDTLKIDQSFVAGIERIETRRELIESIVQLAQRLEIEVVAEGVETEGQASRLTDLQCGLLQGFAIGEPRDAEATFRLMERHTAQR